MSIDTERLHALKGKSFDALYGSNESKYKEMADKALEYAESCVPTGEKVRIGDVIANLQTAVRIDPAFEAHVKNKKLTQKFWRIWFAEYIAEQVYPPPDLKVNTPKEPTNV